MTLRVGGWEAPWLDVGRKWNYSKKRAREGRQVNPWNGIPSWRSCTNVRSFQTNETFIIYSIIPVILTQNVSLFMRYLTYAGLQFFNNKN